MHINYFKPILAFLLIVAVAAGCNSKKAEKPSRLVSKAAAVATDAAKKLTETDHTGISNTAVDTKAVKCFENGQLVIIKNGVKYNATGAIVK